MTKVIHIADEETGALAGVSESSSRSAWAETSNVLPFPTPLPPPWLGDGEADDCFEQVGLVAVRMLARWSLPRIVVKMSATEGPEVEEETPR